MAVLKRDKKSTVRVMCVVKLMDRKNIKGLMGMLDLWDTVHKLARANGMMLV